MLEGLLSKKREAIISRWLDLILGAYPLDAGSFYQREKDQFANPVGSTISREIPRLYDLLRERSDNESLFGPLDQIIRIRAVQDLSPSQAVGFVFLLKKAIREEAAKENPGRELFEEILLFEARIDQLALFAFELYTSCREQIFRIRANEVRNRTLRLLERANLASQCPEMKPDDSECRLPNSNHEER